MRNLCLKLYVFVMLTVAVLLPSSVFALGTAANTTVNNTAQINFTISGVPGSISDSNAFVVQELLDANVLWQDVANVTVLSLDTAQVLSYRVTNTGNGVEQFLLSVNSALGGDNFDPVLASVQIWIDDGNGSFNALADTLYTGGNGPVLNGSDPANDDVLVFVVANIPAGLTAADVANVELTAESVTANAAGQTGNIGAEIIGAGDGGSNANVGLSGADDNAIGTYEVTSTGVAITKSVQVIDTTGGNSPFPGATLRYTLTVQITGATNINNLIITDPIPADTTYTANSIRLNAVAQTDAQDNPADFANFNVSNANAITVDLSQGGIVSIAPPTTFTIIFDVTIN